MGMTNETNTLEQVAWAVQNVGFKLNGYERMGSQRGNWYVSYGDNTVSMHSEGTVGGVPPCALPAGGHLADVRLAREVADQLIRKEKLRRGDR